MQKPPASGDSSSHHFEIIRIVARSAEDRDAILKTMEKSGWFKDPSIILSHGEPCATLSSETSNPSISETKPLSAPGESLDRVKPATDPTHLADLQSHGPVEPDTYVDLEQCLKGGKAQGKNKASECFSVLAKAYVDNMLRRSAGQGQRDSAMDAHRSFTLFLRIIGDKPVGVICPDDISRFADMLNAWPKGGVNKACYADMDAKEIIRYAKKNKINTLGLATQRKHILYLDALFNWALGCKHTMDGPMRLLDMSRYSEKISRKKKSFSKSNIQTIFDASRMAGIKDPLMYWGPLISLYTGMRCQEIAQLYIDNVQRVEMLDDDGNPTSMLCFEVSPDEEGQSIKSVYSRRVLPVHSKLIDMGFERYIDDIREYGSPHLFPSLDWSGYKRKRDLSRWFNGDHLRKSCGITSDRVSLHCFRHTLNTIADRWNVPKGVVVSINGHSDGNDVHEKHYRQRADALECQAYLEKLPFPELNLPEYNTGRFAPYLDSLQARKESLDRRIAEGVPLPKKRGRRRKEVEELYEEGPWKDSP